ncbi:DUF1853 family protein [Kaarinaea lacus]
MNFPFQHASVRDLAWVMASPSMLAKSPEVVSNSRCQEIFNNHYDWLRTLDQQPESLTAVLQKHPSRRLGYYFEYLVAFWLQQRLADDFFASHVRVFEQKRVLGEFDFLFTYKGGNTLVHWETAVKFYLQFTHDDGEVLWYGPNARDRLDIKLDRVFNHQLRLSNSPQGKALLKEKGFQNVQAQTFFKGYLFYPVNSDWRQPGLLPDIIATDHLKGWWTYANKLQLPESEAGDRWQVLPRLEWLAPRIAKGVHPSTLMDTPQLLDFLDRHFAHNQPSLLIVQMTNCGNGLWQEKSRGFVVSAHWPGNIR